MKKTMGWRERMTALALLLLPLFGHAEQRKCLVVGISDGDTLTVRCGTPGTYQQERIRLAEVDAPESGQAWGQRSKEHLSDLCFKAVATIKPTVQDRYGRTVARVECRDKDAAVEQVRAGLAWTYTRYQKDPQFPILERQARAARAGLWADAKPVPPWDYRHAPKTAAADEHGCQTGPKGGRYTLTASGQKRYGC